MSFLSELLSIPFIHTKRGENLGGRLLAPYGSRTHCAVTAYTTQQCAQHVPEGLATAPPPTMGVASGRTGASRLAAAPRSGGRSTLHMQPKREKVSLKKSLVFSLRTAM